MFDDVVILTGGHQGDRHEEDQGRLRSKQPASRGANHVKSTSPQHRPPFRNAQGMYVPKHSLNSRPPPENFLFPLNHNRIDMASFRNQQFIPSVSVFIPIFMSRVLKNHVRALTIVSCISNTTRCDTTRTW